MQNFELCRRRGFKEFDTEAAAKLRLPKQHPPQTRSALLAGEARRLNESSKENHLESSGHSGPEAQPDGRIEEDEEAGSSDARGELGNRRGKAQRQQELAPALDIVAPRALEKP